VIAGRIGVLDGATAFSLRRIDAARAVVVGEYEERLVSAGGAELLAAIGPAVERLFPDVALRPGVRRGVAPELERVLNPPPVPVPATIVATSFALGALVTGGALALLSTRAVEEATALIEAGNGGQPISGSALATLEDDARGFAAGAVGALVIGGAVAAGAGVMALFTDWNGLKDVEP
jgi:hypothetical protein